MSQLALALPEASRKEPATPVERRHPPVTEALKRDIVSALQIEQLPDHLEDDEGKIWLSLWPAVRDHRFLEVVLNDMYQPGRVDWFTLRRAIRDLIDEGRVIEDRHFYAGDQPGRADYRGWKPVFRLPERGEA